MQSTSFKIVLYQNLVKSVLDIGFLSAKGGYIKDCSQTWPYFFVFWSEEGRGVWLV